MDVGIALASSAKWLWESYGKSLVDSSIGDLKAKWNRFKWVEAEQEYRSRLYNLYSTTRLLGNPKPINIEKIFTDVYVLDKITAFRRFDLQEIEKGNVNRETLRYSEKRKPALRLAIKSKRLFVLGKPGAGKTTLLKYLTLLACLGKIEKTPIFVSLKEFSDSKLELMEFIEKQFEICNFPDAHTFVSKLLEKNKAMLFFDGLDEVNQEDNERLHTIQTLTTFARQYPNLQIFVTCRIAAVDYSFDQFTYLEIADFSEQQVNIFANRWYDHEPEKLKRFLDEISRPENRGLKDISRTPLLLAMLCLAFDELLIFPKRRVDLYKEAIDTLLKRWDASRGIARDENYHFLSPTRKEQLLMSIASQNFEKGVYLFRQDILEKQIVRYVEQLPKGEIRDSHIDGLTIIKAIESQHGLLSELAHQVYVFSHLSFQEYFTARNIIETADRNSIQKLIKKYLFDDRWHEIILLTASMLSRGDKLVNEIINTANNMVEGNTACRDLFRWIDEKSAFSRRHYSRTRVLFLLLVVAESLVHLYNQSRSLQLEFIRNQQLLERLRVERASLIRTWYLCREVYSQLPSVDDSHNISEQQALSNLDVIVQTALDEKRKMTDFDDDLASTREQVLKFTKALEVSFTSHDLERLQGLSYEQSEIVSKYAQAINLLVECFEISLIENRAKILNNLFFIS